MNIKTKTPAKFAALSSLICALTTFNSFIPLALAKGTGRASVDYNTWTVDRVNASSNGDDTVSLYLTCKQGTIYLSSVPKKSSSFRIGSNSRGGARPKGQGWVEINGKGSYSAWDSSYEKYEGDGAGSGSLTVYADGTISGRFSFTGYKGNDRADDVIVNADFSNVATN